MKTRNCKKVSAAVGRHSRLLLRTCLALCMMIGGLAAGLLAFSVIASHPPRVHASGVSFSTTTDQPWGLALDGNGNLFVAEPNCDGNPNCGTAGAAPPGIISEYNASTLAKIKDFVPPASYNPMFVALDGNGNTWFTDPTHSAIGKLVLATNTWKEFSLTNSNAGAIPVDLAFDKFGNLWYTDFGTGAIGLFNTATNKATETATPTTTTKTTPYGIAVAPDGVTVWFTENGLSSVGNFKATGAGVAAVGLKEFPFTGPAGTTPHLITIDNKGDAWFSTGFGGQVGEVPAGTAPGGTVNLFCVSNTIASPHISGIGVDNTTGKVWFDDSLNSRLGFLNPALYQNDCATASSTAGVTYTNFAGSPHTHDGLIVDGKGNVYFDEEFGQLIGLIPAGSTLPPPNSGPPPGPTAKTWYFAEGRVGAGFEEFLTIGNPDSVNACVVNITYLLETGAPVTVQRAILAASRSTESVNSDLGTPITASTGKSVSAIIQNATNSPCAGVVAERPMYFNFHGDQSGTDVMGATHTATAFYFADVPSGSGFSSFLTILNPPGGSAASVTVKYFANGKQVGTQSVTVQPGARGTLSPNNLGNLPTHVAAVVTSSQPVVIERPTYFSGIGGGFAGTVTGASSVIGAEALQSEYYFAEGYAGQSVSGGKTQENLVIANLGTTASAVTISLEYINGAKHSFNLSVAPNAQVIWNVNTLGTGAASNEVSADVSSTGGGLVVARQLYFSYAHTLPRGMLSATGGTEVTGLPAAQISKSYSLAEGYSNNGYNEWLTLQNPTATAETVTITMTNGYGRVSMLNVPVGANTRATVDVTAQVLANLVKPGDDHRGYEVSMTVQTLNGLNFVVERPMYINTGGSAFPTIGGTDVFGYNGN